MSDGRCQTCKQWHDDDEDERFAPRSADDGACSSSKFVYDKTTPIDGLSYVDAEHYYATFFTGPRFGCPDWRKRS